MNNLELENRLVKEVSKWDKVKCIKWLNEENAINLESVKELQNRVKYNFQEKFLTCKTIADFEKLLNSIFGQIILSKKGTQYENQN